MASFGEVGSVHAYVIAADDIASAREGPAGDYPVALQGEYFWVRELGCPSAQHQAIRYRHQVGALPWSEVARVARGRSTQLCAS